MEQQKSTSGNDSQKTFLLEMLKEMEIYQNTTTGKTKSHKQNKTRAMFSDQNKKCFGVVKDLLKDGCRGLLTRRLNQNCVEFFFFLKNT